MAAPINFLQKVQTYQTAELAYLLNHGAFVNNANKKFNNFNRDTVNLGNSVGFNLPMRFSTTDSLVANFQPVEQRIETLTVDKSKNVSWGVSNEQYVFNLEDRAWMEEIGKGAIAELATAVESDVAKLAETKPYRFYGNGSTAINSFGQLAEMMALFRSYGSANEDLCVYLPLVAESQIVNSGLNQFSVNRNDEMAMSWYVGDWMGVKFYRSNLLPTHISGTAGQAGLNLTVVSTNDPTGNNITQITFSGAGVSDPDAIKLHDSLRFNDDVSGQPNLRYLTFVGHIPSSVPVQLRATADAASDGAGNVTVSFEPALSVTAGNPNQNLTNNIVAGMRVGVLPSHTCGLVVDKSSLFLAMPQLPEETPFPTANKVDSDTGVSLRLYYGSDFGKNFRGFINDVIWGSTIPPERAMKIAFPIE